MLWETVIKTKILSMVLQKGIFSINEEGLVSRHDNGELVDSMWERYW
ncbi:hypothetical protein VIBC2010_10452 [Vibrio caribbeanicus ATCC BAA-2122]|uniref:Uncharacterized protein n=1 Tax=Vibrio caribbeanicus ATCC BAA-2122 TaxID=796620 RepID=E3BFM5_9VIBR|nr:hypothetical protein VIBC2010_10452 [Vibrio caribbeanicus ATCC BAA-2122]